ncbi:MAG: endonuclease MutS2 [Bacillota bacterium]
MDTKTIDILELPKIKTMLADNAKSNLGRRLALELTPKTDISVVRGMLRETTEAKMILDSAGSPPMDGLADISEILEKIKIGGVLDPGSLVMIGDFLRGCRKTREFMSRCINLAPKVAGYALGITVFPGIEQEINRCISDGVVSSEASPGLKKVRREIGSLQEKIQRKLEQILLSAEARVWLQEPVITLKDSRQVLMVKAGYKEKLPGIVHGSSASGSTVFIEPLSVHQMGNELRHLEAVEAEEVYQVLAYLSGEIAAQMLAIEQNLEIMTQYDFSFAKARLSGAMKGIEPSINGEDRIRIVGGRHPLLTRDPIPLDFYIGEDYRCLIITGPNTGGKTVAMKTIGLLTLMAQAGLHIPAASGTEIAVFEEVLADIGDGQDITQSLSTFSAHITNVIHILAQSKTHTLILLDEVGTGTDPVEGSALAMAILGFLFEQGAITVASTHYPELKQFAVNNPGFKNGCMTFDRINLQPLYRLNIGRPGESNALWIAEKLGLPAKVLEKAKSLLQPELMETDLPVESNLPVYNPPEFPVAESRMTKAGEPVVKTEAAALQIGDLVSIPYLGEKGVVCTAPDAKGRIRVLVKGKKMDIQLKRVKLLIPAAQLYPENYDLNTIFLSKEDRKLKKQMRKRHQPGISRVITAEEQDER